jgi:hypothetical protein
MSAEFDVKDLVEPPFSFTGIELRRTHSGEITAKQGKYIMSMSQLALGTSWDRFRLERQKIAWLCHSRPDIACSVSFAQQVVEAGAFSQSVQPCNLWASTDN